MKVFVRTLLASMLLIAGLSAGYAVEEPLPAVQEIVAAFEREAEMIQAEAAEELSRLRLQTIERLQGIQDRLCRDAKLDEAVAVRERIRCVSGRPAQETVEPLPADAAEIFRSHQLRQAALDRDTEERILAAGRKAAAPLERLLDQLCRDAKLDAALQVREVIQRVTGIIGDVRPDPGHLQAQVSEIGSVWYFDVTAKIGGSIYGTDVYTSDSSLAAAAVHTGALKTGERGIVKVTILPGAAKYESTTRNGVTSHGYGSWSVSFKVERAYGIIRTKLAEPSAMLKSKKLQAEIAAVPAPPYCGPSIPETPPRPDVPRIEPPLPPR